MSDGKIRNRLLLLFGQELNDKGIVDRGMMDKGMMDKGMMDKGMVGIPHPPFPAGWKPAFRDGQDGHPPTRLAG